MSALELTELGEAIEIAFFFIGGTILLIEIVKSFFTGQFKGRGYWDMVAGLSTQIPSILAETVILTAAYAVYVLVADALIPWTFPINATTIALALLACDFVYYWEHRFAHQIRLFWTQHAVHHSSRYMNTSVAARFGPAEGVLAAIMHFPLALIGFPPELVIAGAVVVLAYQTWIHTELIGKLGPLEHVLNTPSNHRVHHGCDEKYIDKNYGGVLIIWDRLFGTYQREEERPNYGLKRDFDSVNPLKVWFSELPGFFRDLGRARSVHDVWMTIFGPPGWSPERKPAQKPAPQQRSALPPAKPAASQKPV